MQVALITGGSRGFGRALARRLAADGWAVVVDGRDPDVLADAAAELRAAAADPTRVVALPGDVTDASHRSELVAAVRRWGRLDLLVANASTLGPTPLPALASTDLDQLRRTFEVNVVAPLALTQLALPLLRAAHGTVVDITSDAAVEAYPGWGGYGASKAALEQLANVLAAEEPDVVVHRVDPGDMRTEMHQAAFPGEDISDRPLPEDVVPGMLALLRASPASGRHRLADWTRDCTHDGTREGTGDAQEVA